MKTNIHFYHITLSSSYNEKLHTKYRETRNTHTVVNIFFRKSCRLWDSVEKYCRAWQATDYNKAQAHCLLGT
jgi:hypothetical protein